MTAVPTVRLLARPDATVAVQALAAVLAGTLS